MEFFILKITLFFYNLQCYYLANVIQLLICIFDRRVDSLNLETPYHADYDPVVNRYATNMAETETEAYIEGQELYLHFFHERVREEGLAGDVHDSLEDELKYVKIL